MNHIQWVKSPKIFTNRSGQAGGGPKAVSLTAFSQYVFDPFPNGFSASWEISIWERKFTLPVWGLGPGPSSIRGTAFALRNT